jgi:hypothetical protein
MVSPRIGNAGQLSKILGHIKALAHLGTWTLTLPTLTNTLLHTLADLLFPS